MKKSTWLRVLITLMMLGAAACVLLGKSIIYGPGFTLSYAYIDALFPDADTAFRSSTTIEVWLLLAGGVVASLLVWLKPAWASLVAFFVCLAPPVYRAISSIQNGYSPLQIDGPWDFFMVALPIVSAILCILLFRAVREDE